MTDTDRPAFAQAFTRLVVAQREKELDAIAMSVYFAGLRDREIEFVVAAAERLATESAWFPKVAEWLTVAATIERERVEAQRALLRKMPTPICAACDDTGWSRDEHDRVSRCDCQRLRRLEVLGRRPWPALPEANTTDKDEAAHG